MGAWKNVLHPRANRVPLTGTPTRAAVAAAGIFSASRSLVGVAWRSQLLHRGGAETWLTTSAPHEERRSVVNAASSAALVVRDVVKSFGAGTTLRPGLALISGTRCVGPGFLVAPCPPLWTRRSSSAGPHSRWARRSGSSLTWRPSAAECPEGPRVPDARALLPDFASLARNFPPHAVRQASRGDHSSCTAKAR